MIRYKLKPVIPVRDWRRDAAETVEMIFKTTRPDVISLCVYMWMDIDETRRRLDASLLDPAYLAAAEEAAEETKYPRCRPFPPRVRSEVYEFYLNEIRRHDTEIPVSISTESPDMWKRLGGRLGAAASNYVCGCGPNSTPWRKKLDCNAFRIAAGGPAGGFEAM